MTIISAEPNSHLRLCRTTLKNSHPNEPNFIDWSDRLAHLERKAREANGTSSRWRLRLGVFRRLGEFILVFSQHLWRMVVFGIAVTVLRDIGKAA